MRDAFGGSFMVKLLIVFIVLYVSFTAIALNYAKAFKVKNKVIQYIEDNEIADMTNMTARDRAELDRFIDEEIVEKMDYSIDTIDCPIPGSFYCEDGISINPQAENDGNKQGTYYVVTTAFGWNIPFLNVLLRFNNQSGRTSIGLWTISGETRTIVSET